jgi:hypothetical protein
MRPRHATSEHTEFSPTMKRICRRVPRGSLRRALNDRPVRLIVSVLARRHGSLVPVRNRNGNRKGKPRVRVGRITPLPSRGG